MTRLKYITEMTDEEILALTEDDLKRIVQLKMMEEGIKIVVRPTEPTYASLPNKDVAGYELKVGYGSDHIIYADKQSAERVLDAIRNELGQLRRIEYMHGASYERTLKQYDDEPKLSVEEVRFYSTELYEQVKDNVEGNKKLKDNFEKESVAYRENHSSAEWIRNEVNNRYDDVNRKYRGFKEMLNKFSEYLELAENDGVQATAFFIKAFGPDRETMEYIASNTEGKFDLPAKTIDTAATAE